MFAIKLAFSVFGLFSLIAGTAGIEKGGEKQSLVGVLLQNGDVDGILGVGRKFISTSVKWLQTMYNVNQTTGCCEECQKDYPSTQMFSQNTAIGEGSLLSKYCSCLKIAPELTVTEGFNSTANVTTTFPEKGPVTRSAGYFTGFCGKTLEAGIGGEGTFFKWSSVDHQGDVTNVKESSLCCKKCQEKYTTTEIDGVRTAVSPSSQMFEFSARTRQCYCYKTKRGQTPVVRVSKFEADICGPPIDSLE